MAPATSPATPAIKTAFGVAAAAATPTIKLAVERMPSLAPSTAALNQPMRSTKWLSGSCRRRLNDRSPVAVDKTAYGGGPSRKLSLPALFAAQRVLQAANRILHLADGFLGLAFRFQLLIAEDLPGGFFDGSLGLLGRAFDSILIHGQFSCSCLITDTTTISLIAPASCALLIIYVR
jgi:hypothetical protein